MVLTIFFHFRFQFMLLQFLMYPISAFVFYFVSNKEIKHFLSGFLGVCMCQWLFKSMWIHSLIASTVTYLLCLTCLRKNIHIIVVAWTFGYLLGLFLYLSWSHPLMMDCFFAHMVVTVKLTMFGFNYHDGNTVLSKDKQYTRQELKLFHERNKVALHNLPSLFHFLCYMYCYCNCFNDPTFEYTHYNNAMERTDVNSKSNGVKRGKKLSPLFAAIERLLVSLFCLYLYTQLRYVFPVSYVYDVNFINDTTLLYRLWFILMSSFVERLRYYYTWKLVEGANVMAGFGLIEHDGGTGTDAGTGKDHGTAVSWSGVDTVDMLGFETATSIQSFSRCWNKRTQHWLEHYVYKRSGNSLLTTYVFCALWHGFSPGFFLYFGFVFILTNVERMLRKLLNGSALFAYLQYDTVVVKEKVIVLYSVHNVMRWFVCWLPVSLMVNCMVVFCSAGSVENCWLTVLSLRGVPHVLAIVLYAVLMLLPNKSKTL